MRNNKDLPPLTEEQILQWADAHYASTGVWPNVKSGAIAEAPGEIWGNIDACVASGKRGLRGNSTLAKLLANARHVRNRLDLPKLSTELILAWADKHHERTGRWPKENTGVIQDAAGETWKGVAMALIKGTRGLPGCSSLARLLREKRGVRNISAIPPLTTPEILAWADAHFERTGEWPNAQSGPIRESAGETWAGVVSALGKSSRGLPVGSSLAQLLSDHRRIRNRKGLSNLTEAQILAWADAQHERTGEWPTHLSGSIPGEEGETWSSVNHALMRGCRGLPGGCSVADLLAIHRGMRNVRNPPKLTQEKILDWIDAHKQRTGQWPRVMSGPIPEAPGETWRNLDNALRLGLRGLPEDSSLARLIQEHRGSTSSRGTSEIEDVKSS